ncbi:MAG: (2Fe-2S)-binding protein [Verrucomicrobiota bacterium]
MYVCLCHAVTDADVDACVSDGHDSVEAVAARTGASTGCGTCTELLCARVALARRAALAAS